MNAGDAGQRGLSLVELMISVAISAAVLSSLVYVYVGSRGAYRNNEAGARVQETGRFALEWISRDLRQSGFMGCLSRGKPPINHSTVTVYREPSGTLRFLPTIVGVFGQNRWCAPDDLNCLANGFANPTSIGRVRGDILFFASLDARTITPLAAASTATSASIADNCAQFKRDDLVVVADCSRAAAVTLTASPGTSCPAGPISLTYDNTRNEDTIPVFRASDRAFVARFAAGNALPIAGYFIGSNRATRPALYRFSGSQTEEVAENVEDLDVLFGVDTNGDGVVDEYRTAPNVAADEWGSVVSVRVSVIAVSTEPVDRPGAGSQALFFRDTDGDTVVDAQTAANDRRLRQVFTTTVALRNRLQ